MRLPPQSRSAIGLLRILLLASLLLPVLLFAGASWLNYRSTVADTERDLQRSAEVAREHAAKIFDGQSQVIDRVADLVRGMGSDAIKQAERPLHEAFAGIVSRLPEVQSVLLADKDGRPLVSAGVYPIPAGVNVRDRDYYQAVIGGHQGTFISSLQRGNIDKQLFFGLARPWMTADDTLAGVIDVAVSPSFFREFYRALIESIDDRDGKVITLIRQDGQILVRYPPFEGPPPVAPATSPFLTAVRADPERGLYESRSIIDSDSPGRMFAYRKVENYPVYVVAGRSRSAVMAEWRQTMVSNLLFGVPAAMGLVALTWTALVRTRREGVALALAETEIQRRQTAEEALLRAQRLEAVGQMTGGVAHDFNNLLTIVLGGAESIQRRPDDPARVRQIAGQIALAARRGGEVTQQLLAFSRRQVTTPETLDLNRRLREFRPLLERAAREAVSVEFDLDDSLYPVRLDPGHFEAAVLNLVGNARDAMPEGGTVVITTRNRALAAGDHGELAAGDYAVVAVGDTGQGMPPEIVARVFEPFFTTKEIGQGTGLGLSQVYGFAKQAGGDVQIVSAVGAGTRVELLLPRTDRCPLAGHDQPAVRAVDAGLQRGVVLVVEDEPALLAMTVERLTELGYDTLAASSPQAALERLKEPTRIDLLFSDVVMPGGMDGMELSVQARRLRPGLRVLLTSGHVGPNGSMRVTDVPVLAKPYDRAQLSEQVLVAMGR